MKHMRNMNLSPVKGIKVRHYVEVLSDCESDMVNLPDAGQIADWVNDALVETGGEVSEVSVKLVSAKEMADLNKEYRQRSDATNVLSFPMNVESETGHPLLGDIAVCPAVVIAEAKEQDKTMSKAKEQEKELTRRRFLASLVKVEGVCAECGISFVFHMPKDWVRRWLNYGGGSPGCKCGPRGLLAPGRALHAYHNGEPCDLPDDWKT